MESYKEIGEVLQISEGSVKVAAHRFRGCFRQILREEVVREPWPTPPEGASNETIPIYITTSERPSYQAATGRKQPSSFGRLS